jgi:hypothetical protein
MMAIEVERAALLLAVGSVGEACKAAGFGDAGPRLLLEARWDGGLWVAGGGEAASARLMVPWYGQFGQDGFRVVVGYGELAGWLEAEQGDSVWLEAVGGEGGGRVLRAFSREREARLASGHEPLVRRASGGAIWRVERAWELLVGLRRALATIDALVALSVGKQGRCVLLRFADEAVAISAANFASPFVRTFEDSVKASGEGEFVSALAPRTAEAIWEALRRLTLYDLDLRVCEGSLGLVFSGGECWCGLADVGEADAGNSAPEPGSGSSS